MGAQAAAAQTLGRDVVGQRGFVASWDRMSALNPGILSLHLVLPQFLQAQPKHCHAHVQSMFSQKKVTVLFTMENWLE